MKLNSFIHDLNWHDLPQAVQNQAGRCLLDTLGTAAAARRTRLSAIIHDFAAANYGGQGGTLWFDGRKVSPPGAALANGMTIDSLDAHDGHPLTKGHAGAAVVPAAFAMSQLGQAVTGKDFLTGLVIGYEVALRAGIALHETACDYHTSGAWNALGCAALAARRLNLDENRTRHALGIAEYHGPRSQMMRCIDHPTMVKDGSGWGAMGGVSAALMARAGFTGAPALTVEDPAVAHLWSDLGERWRMLEQYFKPYPVCRWAQAPIAGALAIQKKYGLRVEAIASIRVETFHEAVRLSHPAPETTEEAQYSLPFPVAAALVYGRLGGAEVMGAGLRDEQVLGLARRIEMVESEVFNERFPARRFARVVVRSVDGRELDSGEVETTWDGHTPPPDEELKGKFRRLAGEKLPERRVMAIEEAVWGLAKAGGVGRLENLLETGHEVAGQGS